MQANSWQFRLPYGWGDWMPTLGECLRCTAPAAVMVEEFIETTLNTN
jgi:hypothetical protein